MTRFNDNTGTFVYNSFDFLLDSKLDRKDKLFVINEVMLEVKTLDMYAIKLNRLKMVLNSSFQDGFSVNLWK